MNQAYLVALAHESALSGAGTKKVHVKKVHLSVKNYDKPKLAPGELWKA